MPAFPWDDKFDGVKTKAGVILDNRYFSEEQYTVRGANFGDTDGDCTPWIDMAGAVFMSAVWVDSAFAGDLAIEVSNSIAYPGDTVGVVGVDAAEVTVTAGVNAYLAISESGGNDGQVSGLGRWARFVVRDETTNAAGAQVYIWVRRRQSVRG